MATNSHSTMEGERMGTGEGVGGGEPARHVDAAVIGSALGAIKRREVAAFIRRKIEAVTKFRRELSKVGNERLPDTCNQLLCLAAGTSSDVCDVLLCRYVYEAGWEWAQAKDAATSLGECNPLLENEFYSSVIHPSVERLWYLVCESETIESDAVEQGHNTHTFQASMKKAAGLKLFRLSRNNKKMQLPYNKCPYPTYLSLVQQMKKLHRHVIYLDKSGAGQTQNDYQYSSVNPTESKIESFLAFQSAETATVRGPYSVTTAENTSDTNSNGTGEEDMSVSTKDPMVEDGEEDNNLATDDGVDCNECRNESGNNGRVGASAGGNSCANKSRINEQRNDEAYGDDAGIVISPTDGRMAETLNCDGGDLPSSETRSEAIVRRSRRVASTQDSRGAAAVGEAHDDAGCDELERNNNKRVVAGTKDGNAEQQRSAKRVDRGEANIAEIKDLLARYCKGTKLDPKSLLQGVLDATDRLLTSPRARCPLRGIADQVAPSATIDSSTGQVILKQEDINMALNSPLVSALVFAHLLQ